MLPRVNNNPPPQPDNAPLPQGHEVGPAGSTGELGFQYPEGLNDALVKKYVLARNTNFEKWFKPFIDRMATFHEIFRNKAQKGKGIPLPIGPGIIESIGARLNATLLNRPKVVEAVPEYVSPDNDHCRNIEDYVNQTVLDVSRRPDKGKALIKAGIIEMIMIWRNLWKIEEKEKSTPVYEDSLDPMQPGRVYMGENETVEVRSQWEWELKNPANVAWEPHCTTRIQDSPWVRERSFMSYNEMLRWQSEGRVSGVERLKMIVPRGTGGSLKDDWENSLKKADGDQNWNYTYADEKEYKVEEWWALMTHNDQQGYYHFFIVEDEYVIHFEDNPLRPKRHPYGSCPFIIDPHGMVGLSALDASLAPLEQINRFAQYQSDLGERLSKPLILYNSASGLTGRTSFIRMYGMQPVDDVNGVKEFGVSQTPIRVVQDYLSFLIGIAREASGANEQFQGTEGADTLGEFQGLVAAAGSRFADIADTLAQGVFESLAEECYLFTGQFGEQMVVRQSTLEGTPIALTREDFQYPYNFVTTLASQQQAQKQEVDKALEVMAVASKLPPGPQGVINTGKIFTDIILPNLGQKNGADWFTQPPMMPPPGMGAPGEMPPPEALASMDLTGGAGV